MEPRCWLCGRLLRARAGKATRDDIGCKLMGQQQTCKDIPNSSGWWSGPVRHYGHGTLAGCQLECWMCWDVSGLVIRACHCIMRLDPVNTPADTYTSQTRIDLPGCHQTLLYVQDLPRCRDTCHVHRHTTDVQHVVGHDGCARSY